MGMSFMDIIPLWNFATEILVILDPSWTKASINVHVRWRQLSKPREKSSTSQLRLRFSQLCLSYFVLACLYFSLPIFQTCMYMVLYRLLEKPKICQEIKTWEHIPLFSLVVYSTTSLYTYLPILQRGNLNQMQLAILRGRPHPVHKIEKSWVQESHQSSYKKIYVTWFMGYECFHWV